MGRMSSPGYLIGGTQGFYELPWPTWCMRISGDGVGFHLTIDFGIEMDTDMNT